MKSGLLLSGIGGLGLMLAIYQITQDLTGYDIRYDYLPNTLHEIGMLLALGLAVALTIRGIRLLRREGRNLRQIKKYGGPILAAIGGIGLFLCILQIDQDITGRGRVYHYTYAPPYTTHEIAMFLLVGLTVVLIVGGIVLWVGGLMSAQTRERDQD